MHSLRPIFLDALSFSTEQASTLKAIGEYRGKQQYFSQQAPQILDTLRQVAIVESIECSNRLEGITAPRGRIEALALRSAAATDRSEQEIAGYRDALALIHESAAYMDFSTNVVLQLHATIHRHMPIDGGRWKLGDNVIAQRGPDGEVERIRFRPVPALQTRSAMEDLTEQYAQAITQRQVEPLVVVPLTILDFLCIHPFTDGNGRVARLLTLLLLYRSGYEVGRYISLERVFEESRETYYETLERCSQGWHDGQHDPYPWMDYFWGVLLRSYREFGERVGTIRTGRGAKTHVIRSAVARRLGPFAISDIAADCPGISRDMVRLVLRQLRDEGAIVVQGKGRGAKWIKT